MFVAGIALAKEDAMDEVALGAGASEEIDEAPGYEDPKDRERKWTVSIGLTGAVSPDYEGSNNYDFGYGLNFALS